MLIYFWVLYEYLNWVLLIVLLLFLLYFYVYFKWIGTTKPILYKSYYLISFICLTMSFTWYFLDELIIHLLLGVTDEIYIRDPNDFINVEFDLLVFNVFFYFFIYFTFITRIFIVHFLNRWIQSSLTYLLSLIYMYGFFVKYITEYDLFLSNWDTFTNTFKFQYKIQLDIALLIRVFFEELLSFLNYIWFILLGLGIYKISTKYVWRHTRNNLQNFNKLRFCGTVMLFLIFYMFFGGETLIRDLSLLLSLSVVCEVTFFWFLFLCKLKRYKN